MMAVDVNSVPRSNPENFSLERTPLRGAAQLHRLKLIGRMKLYGNQDQGLPPEQVVPVTLAEVTLCATPCELRKMAGFLELCAAEMERMGTIYDHLHLSDKLKEFESSPHFVVARQAE